MPIPLRTGFELLVALAYFRQPGLLTPASILVISRSPLRAVFQLEHWSVLSGDGLDRLSKSQM